MADISSLFTVNEAYGTLNNYSVVSSNKNGVYRVDFDIDIKLRDKYYIYWEKTN